MAGGSGKDANYWPGFVDALTNVVIAMVFVIVVLALALSVSAQMLAKRMAAKVAELQEANLELQARANAAAATPSPAGDDIGERATNRSEARVSESTVIGVRGNEAAASAPGGAFTVNNSHIVLEYAANALTLDAPAADKLASTLEGLKPRLTQLPPQGQVLVVARGPDMQLSENQRSAYLRLMAVRNALLERGVPGERIAVRIDTTTPATKATVNLMLEDGT